MSILTGAEIMEQYSVEIGLERNVNYRLIEVDEIEGSKKLFDTVGREYEYVAGKTYRVDTLDGADTITYVYEN